MIWEFPSHKIVLPVEPKSKAEMALPMKRAFDCEVNAPCTGRWKASEGPSFTNFTNLKTSRTISRRLDKKHALILAMLNLCRR